MLKSNLQRNRRNIHLVSTVVNGSDVTAQRTRDCSEELTVNRRNRTRELNQQQTVCSKVKSPPVLTTGQQPEPQQESCSHQELLTPLVFIT